MPTSRYSTGSNLCRSCCIILCGSDLAERYFFEEWQKVTYNPDTYNINYYKEYVGAVEIYTLNEQGERTYGVRLKKRSPKTVDAIALGHASNNTINKVNVSFKYRYWRNIATEPKRQILSLHFKIY